MQNNTSKFFPRKWTMTDDRWVQRFKRHLLCCCRVAGRCKKRRKHAVEQWIIDTRWCLLVVSLIVYFVDLLFSADRQKELKNAARRVHVESNLSSRRIQPHRVCSTDTLFHPDPFGTAKHTGRFTCSQQKLNGGTNPDLRCARGGRHKRRRAASALERRFKVV